MGRLDGAGQQWLPGGEEGRGGGERDPVEPSRVESRAGQVTPPPWTQMVFLPAACSRADRWSATEPLQKRTSAQWGAGSWREVKTKTGRVPNQACQSSAECNTSSWRSSHS
ncbi:hypothetical protein GCM10027030_31470 [Luteococcus sediminum]